MNPFRRVSLYYRSKLVPFFKLMLHHQGGQEMRTKKRQKLKIKNPDAAGIDIGSAVHYVCVPEGRDKECVRTFGCFTGDLHQLVQWLKKCRVKTVVMESTGVYWIPLFQILEAQGFEVKLVNARYVKNVPGRKSDVQDCQWLQQLHSYGLLQGSFRPQGQICSLRSYIRQRESLTRSAGVHIQRMQKALTQMNLHLHKVISDITGLTGIRIIQAILEGERDPHKLASLRDHRVKNNTETIRKALEGDYKQEHLFVLSQEFGLYKTYLEKITECDQKIADYYGSLDTKAHKEGVQSKKPVQKNHPNFDLWGELYRITGVDLTTIPGLDVLSAQTIISEVGVDPHRWPTEKHFTSWLGLSPANKITGEKVFSTRTRRVNNRAATAFRLAAYAVSRSQNSLGAFCRRMKSRLGAPKAITATARKIACIFYRMLKYGQAYVEIGLENYEQKYKARLEKNLQKKAHALGFELIPKTPI
jgi:transposase